MQFDSFKRERPTINITALLDVVFILLIFVILAANFDRLRDLDLSLPTAKATSSTDQSALIVSIPAKGPIRIGEETVSEESLAARLRELRGQHDALLLMADKNIALERAVDVLGEASAAGFTSVSIATKGGQKP